MARPVITRAAEKENGTGSSAKSAPFCPRAFLLSVHPSGDIGRGGGDRKYRELYFQGLTRKHEERKDTEKAR